MLLYYRETQVDLKTLPLRLAHWASVRFPFRQMWPTLRRWKLQLTRGSRAWAH